MNENDARKLLEKEGWTSIFTQENEPHTFFPPHTHEEDAAHIVIKGSMLLTLGKQTKILKEGQRYDVPAFAVHSAKVGADGCVCIIGRRNHKQ